MKLKFLAPLFAFVATSACSEPEIPTEEVIKYSLQCKADVFDFTNTININENNKEAIWIDRQGQKAESFTKIDAGMIIKFSAAEAGGDPAIFNINTYTGKAVRAGSSTVVAKTPMEQLIIDQMDNVNMTCHKGTYIVPTI